MYLKALKLHGFKSFADPTTLRFEPGVTAVVGPNGCGKSNIADSIRWVLGEQSAKALRGGKMQDVIFEGADTRKPAQMCEVSLLLTDCEKQLGSEFHEIEIMRRVHRDGQSEYSLQRAAVPVEGHPEALYGHRHRPDELLDHGAGPDRPDPVVQARGAARGVRRGGRHHQIQVGSGARPCRS
jgi:energy-coupling factor transporter ATP-binding protein EcfA2